MEGPPDEPLDAIFEVPQGVAPGAVSAFISDGARAYLATNTLGTFLGTLSALNASGEPIWQTTLPGSVGDVMMGADGLLYVAGEGAISALTPDGARTSFDGPSLGSLSWHPWNVPMTWGQDGVLVLDRYGNELLRAWPDVYFHEVATGPTGEIYALVTQRNDTSAFHYLWKLDARLERAWWLEVAPPDSSGISARRGISVHEDFVVYSTTGATEARTHEGEFIWRVEPVAGPVLTGRDGTTWIGGARRTAVAANGTILWDVPERSELVLTAEGLAVARVEPSRFGTDVPAISRVDPSDGSAVQTVTMEVSSDFVAPVVVGGRLLGASYRIDTFQGAVGDDLAVSQSSVTLVQPGPSAQPGLGWANAEGPAGGRALPQTPRLPAEEDVVGLWAATRDGAGRALQFTDQAANFDLFDLRVYGIWDYELQRSPRLVQVGTWSLDEDRLSLTPIEDLTGGTARTSLRVRASVAGLLTVDDPLQSVERSFARAARLPGAQSLGGELSVDWIDMAGARRAEFSRITYTLPTDDGGAWVRAEYNATGHLGTRQFRPSFVDQDRFGNITSTLEHAVIGRLDPEGVWTNYFHHEVAEGGSIGGMVAEGDGVRVLGPTALGERERRALLAFSLRPGAEGELTVTDEVPWPDDADDEGRGLHGRAAALAGRTDDGDLVLIAARSSNPDARFADPTDTWVITRRSATGALRWETRMPANAETVWLHDAALHTGDGAVYVTGSFAAPLTLGGETLDPWGFRRALLLRLNLDTGSVERVRALGAGRTSVYDPGAMDVAAHPEGGAVVRFAPGENAVAMHAGVGRTARTSGNTAQLVASFDADLEPRWAIPFESPRIAEGAGTDGAPRGGGRVSIADVAVHSDGTTLVPGRSGGWFRVDGAWLGGQGRVAPLMQISRCGELLPPRWFRARVEMEHVAEGPNGELWGGGLYESNLLEPPFVIQWPGRLPTPSDPYGNTNNLLVRMKRAATDLRGDCDPPQPLRSTVTVDLAGTGAGRVTSVPAGIDCPGTCSAEFTDLMPVTLVAEPAAGHQANGFRAVGASPARCGAPGTCTLLPMGDVTVQALFDSLTVAWAHPLPFRSTRPGFGPWATGATAWVAGDLAAPLQIDDATFDPAAGARRVVVEVGPEGPVQAIALDATTLEITDDRVLVAVVERAEAQRLAPDRTIAGRHHLVALDDQGALLWHHELPNPRGESQQRVVVHGDRVGVYWLTSGEIGMGELEATIDDAAFAMIDLTDGTVLSLRETGRPHGIFANDHGGFTLHGQLHERMTFDGGVGPMPPAGVELPAGATGATLIAWGRDGEFVEATQLRDRSTALRVTRGTTDPGSPSAMRMRGLVPEWVVFLGEHTRFADGAVWVANVPTPNVATPLRDREAVQGGVLRVETDDRVSAAWIHATDDEIVVRGIAPTTGGVVAHVAATRLRDAAGEVLLEDEEYIVLRLQVAGEDRP